MAGQEMQVRTHLRMKGGAALSFDNLGDFPLEPQQGQFALVEGILYVYTALGGVQTWFPLTNKKNSHVHYQAIASTKWTISHNYASTELMYFAYDAQNNLLVANPNFVDENRFELNFATAVKGKCVVFVHSDLWLPRFETTEGYAEVLTLAQYLKVAGGNVIIDSTGVTVNDVNLSTWIKENGDRINLIEALLKDQGDYGTVSKPLRPMKDAPVDVDLGTETERFGTAHVKGLTTSAVVIDNRSVFAVTDAAETADEAAGVVAANVLESRARVSDSGTQAAQVRLTGTDGTAYLMRYNQTTSQLEAVDLDGNAVDLTAKSFAGVDMVLTGSGRIGEMTIEGNTLLGSSAEDTATMRATTHFEAPVTFSETGTIGNGDDDVVVNCGPENLLTVISRHFALNAEGQLSVKNLTVSENLDVQGTRTEANTQDLNTGDQFLNLLAETTGTPALDAGLRIGRGDAATATIRWDETLDAWLVGTEGVDGGDDDLAAILRADDVRILTQEEHDALTAGEDTALHFHASDRDRENHTGTQLADTIRDFGSAVANTEAVTALQTRKVDAVEGKGLSTHDLTDERLTKLEAALTEVAWDEIKDAPDLSGAGPHPSDKLTLVEVSNLRSGKSATGETMKHAKVFGGSEEPSAEESGYGDIWFDTSGESTVVKVKDAETGNFNSIVQVATEMNMRHSTVTYVSDPNKTHYTFTSDETGLPQPLKLKPNFLSVYLNRQLLRKSEYTALDTETIEILIDLSAGDELEVVTA